MNAWWRKGGFTGQGRDGQVAGVVHGPAVALPRSAFDHLGEGKIQELYGADVEITIVEEEA